MLRVHGSCVDLSGIGVLLRGPSGAGKSDLALRLIDGGARLVADDQVEITDRADQLVARPPEGFGGLLEVRGLGIVTVPSVAEAVLALVVDLAPAAMIERLPEPSECVLAGARVRRLALAAFEASTPAKVRVAVAAMQAGRLDALACLP